MNGQLSEHPLAELIHEISSKSLGGRLHAEHERVKVVAYFEQGNFLYAASNVRTLRLREYLKKSELVSDKDLAQFNERVADTDLVKVLCAQKLLSASAAEQVQTRLAADVLRLALLWTEGSWEFDPRSRLNEQFNLEVDIQSLLLEAARRLPPEFVASRLANVEEVITPTADAVVHDDLLPAEGFLLSRLDGPTTLHDLIALSGLGEQQVLGIVYSLAIAGLLKREEGKGAFHERRAVSQKTTPPPVREEVKPPPAPAREPTRDADPQELENFLRRVKNAKTHYDVLDVPVEASTQELKTVYYQLARRYHPDRFRKVDAALMSRIESAFARITQAYDTLRDDTVRANYNAKIAARKKAEQLADSAPKAAKPAPTPGAVADGDVQSEVLDAERAETQFKEGFAALELGQRKVALSLFASAVRAVPNEPRYRAFYGQMLAANEATRRAAETELSAAVKLDPGNAEYRVMLAELYRDLGLKLRAKGEAERAVAADPNNQKARELLRALK
jgi:DnaJ-domain-containing protein 1